MAAVGLDAGSALLAALSILLAVYLPGVIKWFRSFILLRRLPSPKGAGLLAGHAGAYDFMAKHKWEAEVTAALGTVWRRREFWKQVSKSLHDAVFPGQILTIRLRNILRCS